MIEIIRKFVIFLYHTKESNYEILANIFTPALYTARPHFNADHCCPSCHPVIPYSLIIFRINPSSS